VQSGQENHTNNREGATKSEPRNGEGRESVSLSENGNRDGDGNERINYGEPSNDEVG
jgi:hypothetical protein